MTLQILPQDFSICKLPDYSRLDMQAEYCFTGKTDRENSLVCPREYIPDNASVCDHGWRAFRIAGTLDFSLVGILAGISSLLADSGIGIFAVSTFDTDYIFTKAENFERALDVLAGAGYAVSR